MTRRRRPSEFLAHLALFFAVGLLFYANSQLDKNTHPAREIFFAKPVLTKVKVEKVIDGDTIVAQIDGNPEQIRYIGIDTPEYGQEFFAQAMDFNKSMIGGKSVCWQSDIRKKDRYKRILAYVWLEEGKCSSPLKNKDNFVNLQLVKHGFATTMTIPPDVRWQEIFASAQIQAKIKKKGIWTLPNPPDQGVEKPKDIFGI